MNLGCGQRLTARQYAEALVEAFDSRSEIIPVDRPVSRPGMYANIERARHLLGFEPPPLATSMQHYAGEFQAF